MDIYVGIDVSKDWLDIHIRPSAESFRVSRDASGLDVVLERLRALAVTVIAVEATGGFENTVTATLYAAGLPVAIVDPARVREFAKAIGQRAKTDPIDAAVIAHFAEAAKVQIRPLPDEATSAFADLVTRRRQIIQMIVAERQREKRADPRMRKSIVRLLKALQAELNEIDADIDDTIRKTPAWLEKQRLLTSVPGIGPTIARTLIAEMPELGTLSRRKTGALAGLAPFTRQSGRWRGRSFISGGRASVRAALFMGAMVAIRHNPLLKTFYLRLIHTGKPKMVAIIAVARKLITILNAIIRNNQPWQTA